MSRLFTRGALLGALLILTAPAVHAQATLLDEVHVLTAPESPAPVEQPFDVTTAGEYEVVLTDLGAASAPLANVRLAVTRGVTTVGATLLAPGTAQFTAAASTRYVVRITGTPGSGVGSGLFRVLVRAVGGAEVTSFVGLLAPPPAQPAAGRFVFDDVVTVTTAGSYELVLRDLAWPQVIPTLLLAVVEEGGPLVATLTTAMQNPAQQTVTLQAATRYRVFAIAVPTSATAGGLYSVRLRAAGSGNLLLNRAIPVGGARELGGASLTAGPQVLRVADLAYPEPLARRDVAVVHDGTLVASSVAPGDTPFTAVAGEHRVLMYANAAPTTGAGALAVTIGPQGQAREFSAAFGVTSNGGARVTHRFDVPVIAGAQRVRLADFQFPAALQNVALLVVQNGVVLGTPLTTPGALDVTVTAGRIELLSFGQATALGGLFGIDVAAPGDAASFEVTQGIGASFAARSFTATQARRVDASVADVSFPARFTNLAMAVTRGTERVGLVYGDGSFDFQATPGTYFVNLLAQTDATEKAGTYAVAVRERPVAPTVTLNASAASVASGSSVELSWSAPTATNCTASNQWSGAKPAAGTERSPAITNAATFTLTCENAGGSAQQSITVNVAGAGSSGGGKKGGGSLDFLLIFALASLLAWRLAGAQASR